MQTQPLPHVVVVGGGFGGLAAASALSTAPVRVTLIDRRNHHLFQPLLYQVATATLSPADVASPIRLLLRRQRNAGVLLAEAVAVDADRRTVALADGRRIGYDFLVLATGATHHYFGNPEWETAAPGLKTVEDATEIRRRYLLAFEAAEQEPDPEVRTALLTFVVVGAGPTGVEMAGAMSETARKALPRDFRHIDPAAARIILLEGGPRVLAGYSEQLSAYAERSLRKLGVDVRTDSIVTRVEPDAVYVGEERIPTRHVVWAAGVTASPLGASLGAPTDRAGRVPVNPDLSVPGRPEVFVIGDLASLHGPDEQPLPGVAPVAKQQGKAAAANIRRTLAGQPRRPFRYLDKGSMATIGRYRAVTEVAGLKLTGLIAWLAWLFIHILYLTGFRNRLAVFVQWAWSYFSWQRGARLITGRLGPTLAPHGEPLGTAADTVRHDAERAASDGRSVPPDAETTGWMSADRDQATAPVER